MPRISLWPVLLLVAACAGASGDTKAGAGAPLDGLSAEEQQAFAAGRALFDREFTETEGLGPSFNERRCSSCHDVPVIGGMAPRSCPKPHDS